MIKFCLFLFLCFCVFPMSGSSSLASNGSNSNGSPSQEQQPPQLKRKRQPGNPDPDAEVVALSPDTLVATNRFVCEVCHKGFQRDQNLQLHRRGHNLPWKLKQRSGNDVRKKVYVCPEDSCIHHDPARALSDLTGIKKHFCRKHGEKKWQCDKCPKKYAVLADLKAHFKICGTKEYKCVSCGAEFNRRDNYYSHRGGCDALAEETKEGSGVMVEDKGSRVQEKLPEVVSFMPVKGHLSQPAAILDFTYEEINDSLVQELMMGIPAKPLTMEEGPIFSSISSSFFGSPGREASLSSCFQLNASPPPIFEGSGVLPMTGCDPSMSATLLLQQVEQMGAKTGDGGWQPEQMIENTFLNTMAPHSFAIKQEPQGGESELTSSEVDEIAARFFRRHNGAELTPYMETMKMHTAPFYQTNSGSKSTVLDGATGNTFSAETAATPCGLWSLSGSDGLMTMDFLGLCGTMRERKHFRKQARALKKPI